MADQPALQFTFEAFVEFDPYVDAGYMKHFVSLPLRVAQRLADAGITHVEGTLNGHAFRRALQTRGDGAPCLKFGQGWLERAGLAPGDPVTISLAPDPDPNRVDLPAELAAALEADPEAEHLWGTLSVSMRKTLAYNVASAKKPETRQRRAANLLADLRAGQH